MISREELEKMIKNRKMVWLIIPVAEMYDSITLNAEYCEINNDLLIFKMSNGEAVLRFKLNDIYKTQEDAKAKIDWVKKHHKIRRERFEPPTWEEFEKLNYYIFNSKDGKRLVIEKILCNECWENGCYSVYKLGISDNNDFNHNLVFKGDYTKENYEKAVDIARKLFLGEEV